MPKITQDEAIALRDEVESLRAQVAILESRVEQAVEACRRGWEIFPTLPTCAGWEQADAAAIARFRAVCEQSPEYSRLATRIDDTENDLQEARAQVAELTRDRERLEWLAYLLKDVDGDICHSASGEFAIRGRVPSNDPEQRSEDFRDAIDAGMEAYPLPDSKTPASVF